MKLSVIIVSYNVRYFLEQCLRSVHSASGDTEIEVIVVDNNSADDSCSMVSLKFPGVILLRNSDNTGYSAAINKALKHATGQYILLLNPDTVVGEETFGRCIAFMEDHPDAGAIGVRMIDGRGRFLPESRRALPTPETAFYKISGLSRVFPRSRRLNKYYNGNTDDKVTSGADIIAGAFMFLREEAVSNTGVLDEDFFLYGEDIDYSYRLIKAGFRNYYLASANIIHFKGQSAGKSAVTTRIYFFRAMKIFVRKHFSDANTRVTLNSIYLAINIAAIISITGLLLQKVLLLTMAPMLRFLRNRRVVIIAGAEAFGSMAVHADRIAGRISISKDDNGPDQLGNIQHIKEIIRENRLNEVIFNSGEMTYSGLIECIQIISDCNVRVGIASVDDKYIIGTGHGSWADAKD
jgi:GT2 family glycosyltransferase